MTPFLQLVLALAIIILAAKLGGYASYRLGQPTVLGELLVGIAQQVIGDLEQAHTGFLFVVPMLEVHGLGKHRGDRSKE